MTPCASPLVLPRTVGKDMIDALELPTGRSRIVKVFILRRGDIANNAVDSLAVLDLASLQGLTLRLGENESFWIWLDAGHW